MAKKNITIDDLAVMMKNSFDGQAEVFSKRFEEQTEFLNKKFHKIDENLTMIKGQLADVVHKSEFEKLESRVDYLENILALKKN